jgi:hypothetical protein
MLKTWAIAAGGRWIDAAGARPRRDVRRGAKPADFAAVSA